MARGKIVKAEPPKMPKPIIGFDAQIELLKFAQETEVKNSRAQHKQNIINIIFTFIGIAIAFWNIYLTYVNINLAKQSTTVSTELTATTKEVAKLHLQLSAYQSKNMDLDTKILTLETILRKHGISTE